ncbi:MAG: RNA polymerase sigma factor [Anaerolineae bacterium]|nr:RNA polymerase sigma factor [Anaerolineae bacterium]
MSESDLVIRACQGDEIAWESQVRQHQEAVFRLAYLLLGDADEAEDVAQETFIRAFRALDRFDASRPLRPWLLRIATNLAHNRRRAVGRYLAAVRRFFLADPEGIPETGDAGLHKTDAQALWQAVRRLSQADQEVIYLRYFLELSEAEMAAALDVAAGTVKSRLHRALQRLRALVEQEYPALREAYEG